MEGNKNNKHRLWMSLELRILKLNLDNVWMVKCLTSSHWKGVADILTKGKIQTQVTLKCVSEKKQTKLHKSNKNYTKPSFLKCGNFLSPNHGVIWTTWSMKESSWNPTPWGWYVTSAKKIATIWCTNVKGIKTQPAGPNIFIISGH